MLTVKASHFFIGLVGGSFGLIPSFAFADDMAGMNWFAPVDHYCERVAVGLWNEPLNTISNLAFLLAGGVILARQQQAAWVDKVLVALAILASIVGVGSILFHMFANGWSLLADMVPIAVFIYAFFFVALRRFLGLSAIIAGLAMVGLYFLSPPLGALLRPMLGGSAAYVPGLVTTFGVALAVPAFRRGRPPPLLVAAGAAFAVALVFRELDQPLCGTWSTGTHFLWHTFNGVSILLALLAVERVGILPKTRTGLSRSSGSAEPV